MLQCSMVPRKPGRRPQASRPLYNDFNMSDPGLVDSLLRSADNALRALFAPAHAARALPLPPPAELSEAERRHVAGLMRVNHAGEIAAQALYHGQALVSRSPATRDFLLRAAADEGDHLAWCEARLRELGARTSTLNPLWYAGGFAIGALAAAVGDKLSLGFVRETERQVEGHLDSHLAALPAQDRRTQRIIEQMKTDETGHADAAERAGAARLPDPVRALMRATSRVMTGTAYWF
jgi:3-demethoxyubiquinol 3-hydroxylase